MSATNHTPNLNLSQFIPLDKPAWLGDYNSDMSKIDTAVHKVQAQADSMETAVEQATTAAQAATQAAQAATEAAQDAADKAQDAETTANNIAGSLAGKVNKTGDTMTGPLVLPGDPTEDNQAATKKYVDEHGGGGNYLPLAGGTMKGPINVSVVRSTDGSGSQLNLSERRVGTTLSSGSLGVSIIDNPGSKTPSGYLGLYKDSSSTPHITAANMDITDLKDPTNAQDAATKAYVDKHGRGITKIQSFNVVADPSNPAGTNFSGKAVKIAPNVWYVDFRFITSKPISIGINLGVIQNFPESPVMEGALSCTYLLNEPNSANGSVSVALSGKEIKFASKDFSITKPSVLLRVTGVFFTGVN
mgnify:FL=1